jgi:uncharacterized oxidoreductase
MKDKIIVITGGATGIGYAIVEKLYRDNKIISLDRDISKIEQLKIKLPGVVSIQTDINISEQIDAALQIIKNEYIRIDVLINNAGVGGSVNFQQLSTTELYERIVEEITTDYISPLILTKKSLPLLNQSKEALVVFVTSGLAYMPVSQYAGYCASKAAMHSFTLSLQHQLKNTNIKVVEVLPPTVDTDFSKNINAPKITPQKFADIFLKKLSAGKSIIDVGQSASLNIFSRLLPGLAFKMLNKATIE